MTVVIDDMSILTRSDSVVSVQRDDDGTPTLMIELRTQEQPEDEEPNTSMFEGEEDTVISTSDSSIDMIDFSISPSRRPGAQLFAVELNESEFDLHSLRRHVVSYDERVSTVFDQFYSMDADTMFAREQFIPVLNNFGTQWNSGYVDYFTLHYPREVPENEGFAWLRDHFFLRRFFPSHHSKARIINVTEDLCVGSHVDEKAYWNGTDTHHRMRCSIHPAVYTQVAMMEYVRTLNEENRGKWKYSWQHAWTMRAELLTYRRDMIIRCVLSALMDDNGSDIYHEFWIWTTHGCVSVFVTNESMYRLVIRVFFEPWVTEETELLCVVQVEETDFLRDAYIAYPAVIEEFLKDLVWHVLGLSIIRMMVLKDLDFKEDLWVNRSLVKALVHTPNWVGPAWTCIYKLLDYHYDSGDHLLFEVNEVNGEDSDIGGEIASSIRYCFPTIASTGVCFHLDFRFLAGFSTIPFVDVLEISSFTFTAFMTTEAELKEMRADWSVRKSSILHSVGHMPGFVRRHARMYENRMPYYIVFWMEGRSDRTQDTEFHTLAGVTEGRFVEVMVMKYPNHEDYVSKRACSSLFNDYRCLESALAMLTFRMRRLLTWRAVEYLLRANTNPMRVISIMKESHRLEKLEAARAKMKALERLRTQRTSLHILHNDTLTA